MRTLLTGFVLSACVSLSAIGAPPVVPPATTPGSGGGGLPEGLPSGWQAHRSDHFLVAYGHDPARAAIQAQLLESTYLRFFDAFEGFNVAPVGRPMVSLFFESKDDYLHYARQADHVNMSWTVAYYSARTNRTAFYRQGQPRPADGHRGPSTGDDEAQLYGSPSSDSGDTTPHAGGAAPTPPASPAAGRRFADLLRRHPVSLASATHEAAHQLAFNTGLQRRGVLYPLWVSEGLATNFEMIGFDERFGPDRDNPTRRRALARLHEAGDLSPLGQFLGMTHPPTADAHATDAVYAQAWGLFQFLYRHHRAALSLYLSDLYNLPPGPRASATLRREFVRRFGSIPHVEAQWRQWIEELEREDVKGS